MDPVKRTAESITKIINFLLFRVPQKNKRRYLSRIRGKIMRLPAGQIGLKQMPPSASIGQSISLTRNILAGLNPFFVQQVIDEVGRTLEGVRDVHYPSPPTMLPQVGKGRKGRSFEPTASENPPLCKHAQNVVVMPWDPAVRAAVERIKSKYPGLLRQVKKITVYPGSSDHLGHVQSGPGKDPREIHLFKGSIENAMKRALKGAKPSQADYNAMLEMAIVEVIGHEAGHIGEHERTEEQMMAQPFHGEPQAEAKSREALKRIYPELRADDDAAFFNARACRRRGVGRMLGHMFDTLGARIGDGCFRERLAEWQADRGIEPTGRLDRLTLAMLRSQLGHRNFDRFPRNFGMVSQQPHCLCRGGLPDSEDQLKALRDELGIRRIVSLDTRFPELAGWCANLGLEHVPLPFEHGSPADEGWTLMGPSVSGFLSESPTYVHCLHGADRTGGIVARHRTESGWPCDLAYREAKAYGFKDMFVDMIDRFVDTCSCDPESHRHPPLDTSYIRNALRKQTRNEHIEQNLIEPTPADLQFNTENQGYSSGPGSFMSNPYGIRSIPVATEGGGR